VALKIKLPTAFGETRALYVRVNNVEQMTNHDEAGPDAVRFRGYLSKAAFDARANFAWEMILPCRIDVSKPLWPQAYAALKAHDPATDVAPVGAVEPTEPEPLPDNSPKALVERHEQSVREYNLALSAYQAEVARFDREMKDATALKAAIAKAKDA
jgi:hypothetical protein